MQPNATSSRSHTHLLSQGENFWHSPSLNHPDWATRISQCLCLHSPQCHSAWPQRRQTGNRATFSSRSVASHDHRKSWRGGYIESPHKDSFEENPNALNVILSTRQCLIIFVVHSMHNLKKKNNRQYNRWILVSFFIYFSFYCYITKTCVTSIRETPLHISQPSQLGNNSDIKTFWY